jgi:hypothetical protein
MPSAERLQRPDLVQHVGYQFLGTDPELPPPESDQVGIGHMSPDSDTAGSCHGHRAVHRARVAGVEAAGDVGAGHLIQQCLVRAHHPGAEALAEVGVEVDHEATCSV